MDHASDLLRSLYTMAMLVEARDAYTGGHLWRVAQFSRQVAQHMGEPEDSVARIELGGFLHDLGKIGIPDAVLNKRDRLSEEEYAVIKTHPRVGADLLHGHPLATLAMEAVLMHHETPDGCGYPQGLHHQQIPLVARIVGVCDAFDAMTSSRPYRAGMPIDKALSIVRENLGGQFDDAAGRALLALGEAGELEHIVGHSEVGIPLQSCIQCGPTLAIPRRVGDGDQVYCPSCTMTYKVSRQGKTLAVSATGIVAPVLARQPVADTDLIDDMVRATYRALPASPKRGLLARLMG